jgi:YidC/Oxa1 family membrane protein insertase
MRWRRRDGARDDKKVMEKRALIAIALSVAVLLAWQVLFSPTPAPPPEPRRPAESTPTPPAVPPAGETAPSRPASVPRGSPTAAGAAEVVTPLYRASFAADGSVTAWTIDYRGAKRLVVGGALRPLAVAVQRAGQAPEVVVLRPDAHRLEVGAGQPAARLSFTGTTIDGLRIRRTLEFRGDSYRIGATLQVEGARGTEPLDVVMYWTTPVAEPGAAANQPWHTFGEDPSGQHLLGRILVDRLGEHPQWFDAPTPALKDPQEPPAGPGLKEPHLVPDDVVVGEHRWAALEDDYFIAGLIGRPGIALSRGRARDVAQVGLVFRGIQVAPGQTWEGGGDLYVGPKEWDRLKSLGVGLEAAQARNYGYLFWFVSWGPPPVPFPFMPMWWFCVLLLWLMNFFGTWLPGQNYGVAIILLTVLVKVLFYPLSLKSMRSMKAMQALQPQVNALRSKYRSDPQRIQREQMELFRKHGVNPMGGCLPMVVQIPIFYALYLTLQYSVELQGAPFVLWINDLSKKDPYYVLPILMGISMLIQQKMTPTVGDPRQAQIMLIMPVVFTFMFLEFPTGLVLYWLVNNCLTIAQQYLIDRSVAKGKGSGPAAVEREARRA